MSNITAYGSNSDFFIAISLLIQVNASILMNTIQLSLSKAIL